VTSNLKERIEQHKGRKHPDSFSARYNLNKLVYFEMYDTIGEAIAREKIIKGGSRTNVIASPTKEDEAILSLLI
jgi:putative endonuclease